MESANNIDIEALAQSCALRRVCAEDRDLILEMRNQEHVRVNMLNSDIIEAEDHRAWFDTLLKSEDKAFFIFLHRGEPAGIIGFYDIREDGHANWSFYLGAEDNPRGLGSIMCRLALREAFGALGISQIETSILPHNQKSCRLHERLGFDVLDDEAAKTYILRGSSNARV